MAKTTANFNLSKPVRRVAGTILNKEARRVYLNAMIDAEWTKESSKSRKWTDPASAQKSREVPKD